VLVEWRAGASRLLVKDRRAAQLRSAVRKDRQRHRSPSSPDHHVYSGYADTAHPYGGEPGRHGQVRVDLSLSHFVFV